MLGLLVAVTVIACWCFKTGQDASVDHSHDTSVNTILSEDSVNPSVKVAKSQNKPKEKRSKVISNERKGDALPSKSLQQLNNKTAHNNTVPEKKLTVVESEKDEQLKKDPDRNMLMFKDDVPASALVYGQYNDVLSDSDSIMKKEAKIILDVYRNRTREAEIVNDLAENEVNLTSEGAVIDMLALEGLKEDSDTSSKINILLSWLSPLQPAEVRLQALYLLAEVAPDLVEDYMNDNDDSIRHEAERISGHFPTE